MFRNKQVTLKVEKSPKDPMDVLDEPMPIEKKIEIAKEVATFGAGIYAFCKIVDTCSVLIINAAARGIR